MMKKKIILLVGCLLITGCVGKLKAYDSLSENEVIKYVQDAIYKDLKDEVEVEILWKHQETLCDANIDATCFGSHKVPNTYTYKLKIISKNNPEVTTEDNYFTDSYKEDDRVIDKYFRYNSYTEKYNQYQTMSEITSHLKDINYKVIGNQILILSNDANKLNHDFFSYILNTNLTTSYDIYVVKTEELFNAIAEGKYDYRGIAGIGKNIRNSYGYAREYLDVEQVEGYKEVFFRYSSNGCKNNYSCSILYGIEE